MDCGGTVNRRREADVEGVMSQCHVCVQPSSMPGQTDREKVQESTVEERVSPRFE